MLKNDYPGKDFEGYPCCYPPAAEKLVLAQQAVDEKSNEITAVPLLLNMLDLKGTVVTSDAMNTQKNIAQQIIKAGGDYVLAVKGNHPTLEHSLKTTLDEMILENFKDVPHVYHQSTDGGHGRIVTRKVWAMTLPWHSPAPTSPPRAI